MVQKRFGSAATTGRKLDVIGEYLSMYQTALNSTNLQTVYIDGFAGSGEVPLAEHTNDLFDEDVQAVIAGSAERALKIDPPFDRYIFIDHRKKCIDALKKKTKGSPCVDRICFEVGDANVEVGHICAAENWHFQRGVVLLDPFGSQVEWRTIAAIAATKALDLWYLFPAGLGVFRQISKTGTVDPTHEPSITRMYGTEDWKTAFFEPSRQSDFFEETPSREKIVTPESAAQFMVERLRGVFKGGVLDEMVPL
jgi:three-Cys-motif partner protein